ncbi:single-stranded DNA-binding protein [Dyadobacter sp. CY261]|uniref:single-stranded DNA-binding protein n=1 Tax=Dyadobacter sp. CY261 TaxID=2907203 RepID=UPI001F1D00C9|nr:single-stranded DNA-binding protein [Dyadobacter sp. CY261]MCF0075460.1 single-stranded DNA-binding protein [Dyadobacter sp. CY261]
MAKDVNEITIEGGVTKDANVRSTQSGFTVVSFTVATKRSWKDKEGNWQEKSQFHNVVTSGRDLLDIACSLKKGDRVRIENGQLETRDWAKDDGSKAYITEIVVPPFGKIENLGSQRKAAVDDDSSEIPF